MKGPILVSRAIIYLNSINQSSNSTEMTRLTFTTVHITSNTGNAYTRNSGVMKVNHSTSITPAYSPRLVRQGRPTATSVRH